MSDFREQMLAAVALFTTESNTVTSSAVLSGCPFGKIVLIRVGADRRKFEAAA